MLNRIIASALRNRVLIVVFALAVSAYGAFRAVNMPVDVLPDVNRPTVTIMTEANALIPEDIELLVTRPIEQMMNGLPGVTRVRSASGLGLSLVNVEFEWGSDIYRNRQIVQEKLQLAQSKIPPGVEMQMAPVASLLGQIQIIGLRSKSGKTDLAQVRTFADQVVKPRLNSIPGIAQITSVGGSGRQLQVIVETDKLRTFGVTLQEVADAIKNAHINASGGLINVGPKGPLITVTGRVESAEQIARAVIRSDPVRPVLVEDVASVVFGPAKIRIGDAGLNGNPGVLLTILKQPGVDTVRLTETVNRELVSIQTALPEDVEVINDVFQQAAFIHRAVDNVTDAVRDGTILVVVILFLFLLNFRTTFITLTAIPISVAVTAIVFHQLGLTINTMTLGGLAVAIGALVDDAIVDVENVYRRLRQNTALPNPKNALFVIFKASSEVRQPILIGTLMVVVVYLPLFYLSGLEGRLFSPIGMAYIISTLASLCVSLTVTPVLCYYLLGEKFTRGHQKDGRLVIFLKGITEKLIRFSVKYPMPLLAGVVCLVLVGVTLLAVRGSEFLPTFNEGTAQVNLSLPPDTNLDKSNEFGRRLDQVLTSVKGVKNVGRRTGRAEGDLHADDGVNASEVIVTFDPKAGRTRKQIVDEIRVRLKEEFPGVPSEVEQPLSHLLSHLLSGVNAQVAIKIYGPDLDMLRRAATDVEAAIKPIPGVTDLYKEPQELMDQVEIRPDREKLVRHGLTVENAARTAELAGGGEEVTRILSGQVSYPVVVRVSDKDRNDLEGLRNLPVAKHGDTMTVLSDIAEVRVAKTSNNINHENASRRIVVQHNIGSDRSLGEVVADVDKALEPVRKKLAQTPGYSLRIEGQYEAQQEATRLILMLSLISLSAIFLLLWMHFQSVNLSLQVMLSIPMGFIGAAAWIVLSSQTMSVATLVGLISLGGIAARNAILLIDHYLHLMREEKEPFSEEMLVRAGQERMVPVMMTALCSGIGLLPLAWSAGEPGREILYPVATVILGGLITSTICEFLLKPGLFWHFSRQEAERIANLPHSLDTVAEEMAEEWKDAPNNSKPAAAGRSSGELSHG